MQQIALTYEQWKQVHPHYRSIIDGVLHVVAYDDGGVTLMRVHLTSPELEPHSRARPGTGQLPLYAA